MIIFKQAEMDISGKRRALQGKSAGMIGRIARKTG
jgi:hypothetical protein